MLFFKCVCSLVIDRNDVHLVCSLFFWGSKKLYNCHFETKASAIWYNVFIWLLQEFFLIITWTSKRLNILWVVWKATKQVCQDENLRKILKDPERSSWGPFRILQRIFIMIFEKSLWIIKIIVKIFKDL